MDSVPKSSRSPVYSSPKVVLVEARDYHRLIQGMQAEARPLNWQLMSCDLSWENLPHEYSPIGAVVWQGSEISDYLSNFSFPIVRFCYIPDDNPPWKNRGQVAYDIEAAGRLAAEHFIERGFSNVAFIKSLGGKRQELFTREFNRHTTASGRQCFSLDLSSAESQDQVKVIREITTWLKEIPKPVGIQTFTDQNAVGVLHACIAAGLRVPEDVAVMGRTNHPCYCELAPIPLSSVDPDGATMGREAIRLLKHLVDGCPETEEIIKIPPKIVLRKSTDTLAVNDPRVSAALRFMYDYLSSPLTIEDIAAETGCSKRTIERAFTKHLGRSVNAELRRKRIEQTCILLRTTDMTVAQIANNVGLATPEYLHRLFKEMLGITPREYRQAEAYNI